MPAAQHEALVITARAGSSVLFKLRKVRTVCITKNRGNRNLGSAAHASIRLLESSMNQAIEPTICSNLPSKFFDNLANHGMLDINPWSFVPLAGINGKPEQSNQHRTSIHKTGPGHIARANNSVNNLYAYESVLKDLLELTSYQSR